MEDSVEAEIRNIVQRQWNILDPERTDFWSSDSKKFLGSAFNLFLNQVRSTILNPNRAIDEEHQQTACLLQDIARVVRREREIIEFLNDPDLVNPRKRWEKIESVLQKNWKKGFLVFFEFLQHVRPLERAPMEGRELTFLPELDYEMYLAAIRFVQARSEFEDWKKFVRAKEVAQDFKLDFSGAAHPNDTEKIRYFVRRTEELPNGFWSLLQTFKSQVREIWGADYEAFFTGGGANEAAFKFFHAFSKVYPKTPTLVNNYEYLPMMNGISSPIEMAIEPENEDEISFLEKIKKYKSEAISKNPELENERFAVFFSSRFRGGILRFDLPKLVKMIRDFDPQMFIFVDGAQDSRFFAESDVGDVFFSSKRKQITLISQKVFPQSGNPGHALSERRGGRLNPQDLAALIINLFFARHQIDHCVPNLTQNAGLWDYRGRGEYVKNEMKKAQQSFEKSPALQTHFELLLEREVGCDKRERMPAQILQMRQKLDSDLDIWALSTQLKSKGLKFDIFCLHDECLGGEKKWSEIDFSAPLNIFLDSVREFQNYYLGDLGFSLLPPADLGEAEAKNWVGAKAKEHRFFRLFLDVNNRPDEIIEFLRIFAEQVSEAR